MGAPSLVSMAQRACARDIHAVQDVGDMQWELAGPIVRKVTNPQQLRNIEIASPQILDHTGPLWKAFIARDVPEWEDKIMEPKNPRSWWKVYRKLMKEEQQAKDESEQALMAALKGLDEQKEANKLNFVNKVLDEPLECKPIFVDGQRAPFVNDNGKIRKPVLKNARTGREVISALRRETSLAKKQRGLIINKVAQPTKAFVPPAKSQIAKAPQNMVREHQKPQLTAAAQRMAGQQSQRPPIQRPAPKIFANRTAPSLADRQISEALREEQAKKEDRLRALASGRPPAPSTRPTAQSTSTVGTTQPSRPSPAAASPLKHVAPASSISTLAGPASQTASTNSTTQPSQPTPAPASSSKPVAPASTTSTLGRPSVASPARTASPAPSTSVPASRSLGEVSRQASPSPAPPVVRKRPAPSIFMPQKKRKV